MNLPSFQTHTNTHPALCFFIVCWEREQLKYPVPLSDVFPGSETATEKKPLQSSRDGPITQLVCCARRRTINTRKSYKTDNNCEKLSENWATQWSQSFVFSLSEKSNEELWGRKKKSKENPRRRKSKCCEKMMKNSEWKILELAACDNFHRLWKLSRRECVRRQKIIFVA